MLKIKENDLVYTPFGYGNIVQISKTIEISKDSAPPIEEIKEINNSELVSLKMKWGGMISLQRNLIKKKISIHIKTFFGARKTFTFELDINTSIQQLKNLILERSAEQAKTLYNIRLIYPMGAITELSVPNNNLESYKIPDNAKLVLVAQTTFFFDPNLKGTGIKLSNNNLTANKNGESDYHTVLGNLALSSGRTYWELKIEKFVDEEDIFIGIARKNINLYTQPTTSNLFWGYLCLCGRKFGPDGVVQEYGFASKLGDVIGVLLEFRTGVGTLSFYRNGTKCGQAFTNLSGIFYPAVSLFCGEVQVTLDPKAPFPLN